VSAEIRDLVEEHVRLNPDASVVEVLGALTPDVDPVADRELVENIVGGSVPEINSEEAVDSRKPVNDAAPIWDAWSNADFASPNSGVWPEEWLDREQWMGHVGKKPFAPWGDRDAPAECSKDGHDTADTCDCDARWKWGYRGHYGDGETIAMAEIDPRLDGRAFIQREDDPYVYVDGDDVRDPETGEVHPAFLAILEHLGATYSDVSQSGTGVHAVYRGEFPEDLGDVKQAAWRIDEDPWGSNDDLPSIEIYPGKRVCVATGDHVPGTPEEIHDWNDEVLGDLLEANDQLPKNSRSHSQDDVSFDREDYDLEDYNPEATGSDETTSDIRDVFAAVDHLNAQRVAEQTIVAKWNDDASTSEGERAFWPTWGSISDSGTANIVNDQRWQDTGELGGYGGPVTMAAIDAGELRPANARPVDGKTWWLGVEHLRKLGFDIPNYEVSDEDGGEARPVSALPVGQLEALPHADRRRAAKKRGLEWPTTREARDRLFATITEVMRNEDTAVVDAPTSLGKSHTISTTAWDNDSSLDGVTGGGQVVHLQATRNARDEAIVAADEAGIDWFALKSRHEACPVAAGDYDPPSSEDAVDEVDYTPITMDGQPASEWIRMMCEGRGIPFSAAHRHLEKQNDQGTDLPCCSGTTTYDEEDGDFDEKPSECPSIRQWETLREGSFDVVFATHNFAHVPGLRMGTNLIIDEEPDFIEDLTKDRVERAITAYLQAIDAPVTNWESFVGLARYDGFGDDAYNEREALQDALNDEPDREHYFENPDSHTLAPALARAIFNADERGNGRLVGKTAYEPPRLDAQAHDDDGWNREWVTVVLTEDNELRTVRCAPDFSQTRSVVGLDAWPSRPKWMVSVHPSIQTKSVLEPEERQLWRRYERGLRVVQVGDATRPLASGEYFNEGQVRTLVEHLVDEYSTDFRTAITTSAVEGRLKSIMAESVPSPDTMHYGEEKSRNDFADEPVGLIEGSIDPGDDFVLDLLAELDLDASPEISVDDDGEEHRAHGRGFVGDDSDSAAEILASVRENHTAQAAGRYARNPNDPESHATVFVRTDAMPVGFADVQTPGVEWVYSDKQQAILEELRSSTTSLSAREVADGADVSKEHARTTLKRLADRDTVQAIENAGRHGATLYADSGLSATGVANLSPQDITNDTVWGSYTWVLAIRDVVAPETGTTSSTSANSTGNGGVWDWRDASNEGNPPS